MKQNNMILILLVIFSTNVYGQFMSTSSSKLFSEMPRAENVGDTVWQINYTSSPCGYVLKKIDKNHRYHYRGLVDYKDIMIVSYHDNGMIKSFFYEYRIGLMGGAGKGYFHIDYYDNGNIKYYSFVNYYYVLFGESETCFYDSLNYKEEDKSKINCSCYRTYKIGRNVYLTKKRGLKRRALRQYIKNNKIEPANHLIDDYPFKLFLIKEDEY